MVNLSDISEGFLSARREARPLDGFPGVLPVDLETAYAVQHLSAKNWGEPIVGYKVGGIGPQWRDRYPSSWLAGPVFPSLVYHVKKDGEIDIPVFAGGFAAYEPELVFVVDGISDIKAPITSLDMAKDHIKAVSIGAEIASSPLSTINDLGPGCIISDFGNQHGVVIGSDISLDWLDHLDDITVTMTINGKQIGQKPINGGEGGPLDALRFLLNHLRDHAPDGGLPDQVILSSGAITGVHRAEPGSVGHMDYGSLGSLTVNMVPRQA